ncbi:MAG TPA: sensor histidine kinase [Vicinamibacterales bacterium]|nr:sensor histidine kinase [Vicinamibacterales bacterium]
MTLVAVIADGAYITRQVAGLRALQTDLADRSRKDSLHLLRIENDLNTIALAMRDMIDITQYPLTAWRPQFVRVRADLEDALQREEAVALARRTPEQRRYLISSVSQFWDATDRMFATARDGTEEEARSQIRLSLLARQAALSTTVARLLVANNVSEEETARQVQAIYTAVQRQAYLFVGATLIAILVTSLYVIRTNRRLFAELTALSQRRHELAGQLITTRESTLREISRELHDEFGQILTAMGSMLSRAGKHAPEGSPLRAELREVNEIAQTALNNVRGLSQALHPSILEDAGLDDTLDWYVPHVERQLGIVVSYERVGSTSDVDTSACIHVYRVLQEALNNVARHSGATQAWVRLRTADGLLELEVEDHGRGLDAATERRGLGIVTMRERAELVGGTIEFLEPREGGTLVRLQMPTQG